MMMEDKVDNVIHEVLEAIDQGQLLLSFHAMEQMELREVKFSDAGDKDLRIIIVFSNPKTVIVTVIDLNRRD